MTSVDFARVRRLVELVHDLAPAQRDEQLARECSGDSALRAEVEAVLRAARSAPAFLASPADSLRIDELLPNSSIAPTVAPGSAIEGFRLVRRVASGGMGTVWEAEQSAPRRKVALKTLRSSDMSRDAVRRFRHESEILARLRHPNVAQVFASGVHELPGAETLPWYAMEFVEDARTLTEFVRERALDLRARLELFSTLCDAVQHGHERGVIHRDLKPSNVLVDGAGRLKVIDFGVARVRDPHGAPDGRSFETEVGRVIGTLQYMSPEQVAGASDGIDTRSDVYALGVMLYELVTGALPYDVAGVSLVEAARILSDETPPRPSSRTPEVDVDLDAIVLMALEKNRARRYPTAAALAADLGRHARGEAIEARPPSVATQMRAYARKHRVLVGSIAAVATTLTLAAPLGFWLAWRATRAERDALAQRDQARFREYGAEIAAAYAALRGYDTASARQHLERCEPSARGFEWWVLDARADRSLWTRAGDGSLPIGALWHPDGERIFVGSASGRVEVRDAASGEVLAETDLGRRLNGLDLDPLGRRLAFPSQTEVVTLDSSTLAIENRWTAHERAATGIAFSPTSQTLISSGFTGDVTEWDAASGRRMRDFEDARAYVWCLAVSPDLAWLAGGASLSGEVIVWSYATGRVAQRLTGHTGYVSSVAFDRDSAQLASSSHDHTLRLWNPCTGELRSILRGHADIAMRARFDPSGARMASSGWDRTVRLWDASDARLVATLAGAGASVGPIAFSPDGERLIAGDDSSHVKLWDVASPDPDVVRVRGKWFWKMSFWPDGQSLLAVHGGSAHRYSSSGKELASYRHGEAEWSGAAVAPDGERVALGDSRGYLEIRDADGRRVLARVETYGSSLLGLDWSADGRRIASSSHDGRLLLFEGDDWAVRQLMTFGISVRSIAFEPGSGERIAVVGARGELHLVDAASGADTWVSAPALASAYDLAWSPDARLVAAAYEDGRVLVWNVATRTLEHELFGHTSEVHAVAFSRDGARLASGSVDRSIRLWELASGREVAAFIDHAYSVEAIAFSPDGATLASGSSDSTLRWWRAADGAQRHVDQLARSRLLARDVLAELERAGRVDPRERELAAAGLDDPRELAREAWIVAAAPVSEPAILRAALARAQVALRYLPRETIAVRALAATHLRLGDLTAVLDVLDRNAAVAADDLESSALRALALARLHRGDEARREVERIEAEWTRRGQRFYAHLRELLGEAKELLAAR